MKANVRFHYHEDRGFRRVGFRGVDQVSQEGCFDFAAPKPGIKVDLSASQIRSVDISYYEVHDYYAIQRLLKIGASTCSRRGEVDLH